MSQNIETRKEYAREYQKKWRAKNKERNKEIQSAWRAKNIDHVKEAHQKYYTENKEKIYDKIKERFATDPEYKKRHYKRNANSRNRPEAKEKARWRNIFKKYGLTKEAWEKIYHDQGGRCYICQRTEQQIKKSKSKYLVVDHDHNSGRIRGLLCGFCNRTVLTCIRESADTATRLLTYLTRDTDYGTTHDKD